MTFRSVTRLLLGAGGFALSFTAAHSAQITGKYFGSYEQSMYAPLFNPGPKGVAPAPRTMSDGTLAWGVLGTSVGNTYWLWDFDNKTITLGGGSLRAMDTFFPEYRLFSPTRTKITGERTPPVLSSDAEVRSQVIGTFVANGDDTYSTQFNLQIFLDFAGFPLTSVPTRFRVTPNQDGSLQIVALDEAPTGVVGADGQTADGVPGVVKPDSTEEPVNYAFPFRVSPTWDSVRMRRIGDSADCNEDGIPDAVADELGLETCVNDNDADGILDAQEIGPNWAQPLDSDSDGVPDVLERADASRDKVRLSQLRLPTGERIDLQLINDDGTLLQAPAEDVFGNVGSNMPLGVYTKPLAPRWLGEADRYLNLGTHTGAGLLPEMDGAGQTYNYEMGQIYVQATAADTEYSVYRGLRSIFEEVKAREDAVVSQQAIVATRQAAYDANPTTSNLNRLNAAKTALETREATLADYRQRATAILERGWRARGTRFLGAAFSDVSTLDQYDALLVSAGINPATIDTTLKNYKEMRLTFPSGVPQGLRLVAITSDNYVSLYNYAYAGNVYADLRADWRPTVAELSFTVLAGAKTISFRLPAANAVSQPSFSDGIADSRPAAGLDIILAHTERSRAFTNETGNIDTGGDGDDNDNGDTGGNEGDDDSGGGNGNTGGTGGGGSNGIDASRGRSGGGGAMGWFFTVGLFGLHAVRRHQRIRQRQVGVVADLREPRAPCGGWQRASTRKRSPPG